ncbi:hypothetical protein [Salinicola tamaricis]|uniref:hypothetical protein n=1 Tax=Salinicola tamaricis TaxID=1771309 RepID=UPI000D0A2288|nr:hypothetical protein [Salinicola tamaricis]
MKVLRLPLLLIFLGSLLLALFFGWMLVQALHNDREAFRRDLAFQSKEQGITVSAARAGLERRVQVLANLAADPVIRNLLLQAARELPASPARNAMLRERLRANLQPYWEALRESGALELNLFLPDANDIDPLVGMDPPDTHEQHSGDSDYLLRRAQHLRTVVFGIEFDGQRATTGGVPPCCTLTKGVMGRWSGCSKWSSASCPTSKPCRTSWRAGSPFCSAPAATIPRHAGA